MENKKNNQPLDLAVTDPEWTAITTAFAGQEVPAASPLTGKERWLCVLSALLGCQGMGAFRKALGSAPPPGGTSTAGWPTTASAITTPAPA